MTDRLSRRAVLVAGLSLFAAAPLRAQVPVSLTLATPTILCTQDATGQITLSTPAPESELTIPLSSSMPTKDVTIRATIGDERGGAAATVRVTVRP